jgi:hypothetical protein
MKRLYLVNMGNYGIVEGNIELNRPEYFIINYLEQINLDGNEQDYFFDVAFIGIPDNEEDLVFDLPDDLPA